MTENKLSPAKPEMNRGEFMRNGSLLIAALVGSALLTRSDPPSGLAVELPEGFLEKFHGLNFSAIIDGQDPDFTPHIPHQQIEERLKLIVDYTQWVMTYWCTKGMEVTGKIAHDLGLKVAATAWLEGNENDPDEIRSLIKIGQQKDADMLVVGVEVLHRGDLSLDQHLTYIKKVKQAVPDLPVITADWYNQYLLHPELIELAELDFIAANCYPYWNIGTSIYDAMPTLKDWYGQLLNVSNGKKIIISETSWPTEGWPFWSNVPSPFNARWYLTEFTLWAQENNLEYFIFEAHDENWKPRKEGTGGSNWGIVDSNGTIKPETAKMFKNQPAAGR